MEQFGIPLVDLASFTKNSGKGLEKEQKDTVEKWGTVMKEVGFAIIVNHGLPQEVIDRTFRASEKFFLETSMEEKMQHNFGSYGDPKGGFTAQGVESVGRTFLDEKAAADLVESYVLNNGAMEHPEIHNRALFEMGKEYRFYATKVMHLLHRISALALGVDADYFDQFYAPPHNSLRYAHYPPLPDHIEDGQIRYGPHYDYEGFTILAVDGEYETGLEVYLKGRWSRIKCPRGGLIVNVGELITYWTNGEWRSTLHRVSNPLKESPEAKRHRFSLPFFTAPHPDSLVKPIFGDGSKKPIRAHDHLMMQLQKSNL